MKNVHKALIAVVITAIMVMLSVSVVTTAAGSNASLLNARSSVLTSATNTTSQTSSDTLYISPGPSPAYVDDFNPFSPYNPPSGIDSLLYEPLYQINAYNGTAIPWLATNYSWSANDTVLTFHLRQNVTFSNGDPFNATDVVFTFNMEMQDINEYPYLSSVKAMGNYTVIFNFKTADVPDFFYIASNWILPESQWQGVTSPLKQVITNPIGTGPYVLSSFSPQEIILVKNTHYWQPNEPHIPKIEYIDYTSNNALVLALADGQVDWAPVFSPNITSLFVNKDPTYNHYFFPQGQTVNLLTNDLEWPFNQSFFRVALSLSINRTQISSIGEYGYEQPANAANIMQQQEFWLNSTNQNLSKSLAQYNTSEALSILESHGYYMSGGRLYAQNGTEIPTITLMTVAGYTDWDSDVSIISQNLKSIGLNVNIVTPTSTEVTQDIATGNFQMAQEVVTSAGPNPWYDYTGIGGPVPALGTAALTNEMRWNSSGTGFYRAYESFRSTSNPATQKQLINDMAGVMLKDMPVISLVYSADWYEYVNKTIGGFVTPSNNYWIPLSWDPGIMEVVALHLYVKSSPSKSTFALSADDYYIIGGVVAAVVVIGGVYGTMVSRSRKKNGGKGKEKEE